MLKLKGNYDGNDQKIYSNTIEKLFDIYGTNIVVSDDKRYFAELPNMELEYYDEKDGSIKWGEVEFIEKHLVDKLMFRIEFEDGNFVEITEDHSLMVFRNGQLIMAKVEELIEDDIFITLQGKTKINNIKALDSEIRFVYDIQMKDTPHTFFANGVLIHNSIFFKPYNMQKIDKIVDIYNKEDLPNLIKSFHPKVKDEYIQYELEKEYVAKYAYFSTGQKRYYMIKPDGDKVIKGLNIIKKDYPKFIKNILDSLFERAVKGEININHLKEIMDKIKSADYPDIAVHKFISKPFHMYKKQIPQHVAGAMFANEIFNLKIRNSDIVYLFYIINKVEMHKKPSERQRGICLRVEDFHLIKDHPEKMEIDYIELMEKQIIQPMREFSFIPEVVVVINEWCKMYEGNGYRVNKKGQYVFKKITKMR